MTASAKQSRQILLIGPSWIGDMVMTHALVQALIGQDMTVQIDILAPTWSAPVIERMPGVRRCLPFDTSHGQLHFLSRLRYAKSLQSVGYDECIVCPNSFKSALLPFFARIPVRRGWVGEQRYGVLTQCLKKPKQFEKMVTRYTALAYNVMPTSIPQYQPKLLVDQENLLALEQQYPQLAQNPMLALCPGAAFGPAKRWPAKYFHEVAKQYTHKGWSVAIFGSKDDHDLGVQISKGLSSRVVNLCGQLPLGASIDLLSKASLCLTNDSGLMHIAAALDIPLLALYGSSAPTYTPPLSEQARLIKKDIACSPCFKRTCPYRHYQCLESLTVDEVLSALEYQEKIACM